MYICTCTYRNPEEKHSRKFNPARPARQPNLPTVRSCLINHPGASHGEGDGSFRPSVSTTFSTILCIQLFRLSSACLLCSHLGKAHDEKGKSLGSVGFVLVDTRRVHNSAPRDGIYQNLGIVSVPSLEACEHGEYGAACAPS
jgi:hypothetical protein